MGRIGKKLFCGFLLTGLTWGCTTESPSTDQKASVTSENKSENPIAPDSSPPTADHEQAALEMPELMVPARTTNSQDAEVHPASAVEMPASPIPVARDASPQAFSDLVDAFRTGRPEQWTRAEAAIHAGGSSVLPALFDGLQSADRQTRELASMMLAQVLPNLLYADDLSQRPELAPLADRLRHALQDESVEVRINVAVALSLMEGEGSKLVPIFQEMLRSDLPHVRTMSVVALGGLGPSAHPALPAMERMSQTDPDPHAKAAAVEAVNLLRSEH